MGCVADRKLLKEYLEGIFCSSDNPVIRAEMYLNTLADDNPVTMKWIRESCADPTADGAITVEDLKSIGIPEGDAKRILMMRRRRLAETSPGGSTQPSVASAIESAVLIFLIVPILFLF